MKKRGYFFKMNDGLYVSFDQISWIEVITVTQYKGMYPWLQIDPDDLSKYVIVFFKKFIEQRDGKDFRGSWRTRAYKTKKNAIKMLNKFLNQEDK